MRRGVVFDSDGGDVAEVRLGWILAVLKKGKRLAMRGGVCLMAGTVLGISIVGWPVLAAEIKYGWWQTPFGRQTGEGIDLSVKLVGQEELADRKTKPDWQVPDENFSIYIPKIFARSRVIPNVNPFDKEEYQPALRKGVAQARGLSDPGKAGTTYLFAHSVGSRADYARYNAVFYLLHKMEAGDGVEVVYKGNWYKYRVVKREILGADEVDYLTEKVSEERLILATCYPPGTTWKRLVVTAKRYY